MIVKIVKLSLLVLTLLLLLEASAVASISSSDASNIALSFAPKGAKLYQVYSSSLTNAGARRFYVYYRPSESSGRIPQDGHAITINSEYRASISYYLTGQLVASSSGPLAERDSWKLTRQGEVVANDDSLLLAFRQMVAEINNQANQGTPPSPGGTPDLPGNQTPADPGSPASDAPVEQESMPAVPDTLELVTEGGVSSADTGASPRWNRMFGYIKDHLGIRETCGDNCGPSIQYWTGGRREPWCAWWATWVIRAAGNRQIPRSGSVPALWSWAGHNDARFRSGYPRKGWLAVFGSSHIGIVTGVFRHKNNGKIYIGVVSGNTGVGNGVDGVAVKYYRTYKITGYIIVN